MVDMRTNLRDVLSIFLELLSREHIILENQIAVLQDEFSWREQGLPCWLIHWFFIITKISDNIEISGYIIFSYH